MCDADGYDVDRKHCGGPKEQTDVEVEQGRDCKDYDREEGSAQTAKLSRALRATNKQAASDSTCRGLFAIILGISCASAALQYQPEYYHTC